MLPAPCRDSLPAQGLANAHERVGAENVRCNVELSSDVTGSTVPSPVELVVEGPTGSLHGFVDSGSQVALRDSPDDVRFGLHSVDSLELAHDMVTEFFGHLVFKSVFGFKFNYHTL